MRFLTVSLCFLLVAALPGPQGALFPSDISALRSAVLAADRSAVREARYAIQTLVDLGVSPIPPQEKKAACALAASALAADKASLANVYHAAGIVGLLEKKDCAVSIHANTIATLSNALESNRLSDIYAGALGMASLASHGHVALDTKQAKKAVASILDLVRPSGAFLSSKGSKGDGSVLNAGLAFESLAALGVSERDAAKAVEGLSKLVASAERLDGNTVARYLRESTSQGPLALNNARATSGVLSGALAIAKAVGGKVAKDVHAALDDVFVVGATDYFISQKHVRTLSGIQAMARGIRAVVDSAPRAPLVVTLSDSKRAGGTDAAVDIRVTNALGGAVPKDAVKSVTMVKLARVGADAVVAKDTKAKAGKAEGQFLAPLSSKLTCATHWVTVDVEVNGNNVIGVEGAVRPLVSTCAADVYDAELVVVHGKDKDTSSLTFGESAGTIKMAAKDTATLTFKVRDGTMKGSLRVHQAMVRLSFGARDFVSGAEYDAKKQEYTAQIQLTSATVGRLGRQSGAWAAQLILGDDVLDKVVMWQFATLDIAFRGAPMGMAGDVTLLPLIEHQFRAPASRPASIVSLVFTALALAPLAMLLVTLPRLGANVGNWPSGSGGVFALLFHILLGVILTLLCLYWWQFNLVQTLGYLGVLSVPMFVVTRGLLGRLQAMESVKEN